MEDKEIKRLTALLDERTMALMARESDLADRMEEIEAQKEELTAAVEELDRKNKILETALEELKERNQELDQILYRASHDLRSPVTSISGILNILQGESVSDMQQKCFDHIRDKASQMDNLLTSLSALSKTISNDIHFSRVNVETTLRNCICDLRQLPNFSQVSIKTEISGLTEITTDQTLLTIVIKNLLSNSLIFRDASKRGDVVMRAITTDAYLEIEIVDDGVGIPDVIKDRIFDMFYRGSELSTGSGLGLYIVRKVVDQLRGHIQFTCGDAQTRFKVVLPQASLPGKAIHGTYTEGV